MTLTNSYGKRKLTKIPNNDLEEQAALKEADDQRKEEEPMKEQEDARKEEIKKNKAKFGPIPNQGIPSQTPIIPLATAVCKLERPTTSRSGSIQMLG